MNASAPVRDDVWLGEVFERHAPALLAYARRRLASEEDADDVCAEVFAVAWRRRDVVPNPPLPWLYGVAANCVAHVARARARSVRLGERLAGQPPGQGATDPATVVPQSLDARAQIAAALVALPESDAEVLRLWAWEQLEPSEIAQALGCSPGAARTRLHRAKDRLRVALCAVPSSASAPGDGEEER